MKYKEIIPGEQLRQYIKCYYLYESDTNDVYEDNAFATGCVEIMFNLGTSRWQANTGNGFQTTPLVELCGQIIEPLAFKSLGLNTMLGVRFYPHAASIFLNTDVSALNNKVTDLREVAGNSVYALHSKLLDITPLDKRVEL